MQLEGLFENADGDIQIPNGDKSILKTATVKGLQGPGYRWKLGRKLFKGSERRYDVVNRDEMGWDFSD